MRPLLALSLALSLLVLPVRAAQPDLELSCPSAILVEKETGQVLYEQAPDQPMEPASVTKVMTLLLVMEALEDGTLHREDVVTVSPRAASMGGSQVYLKEGEQLPVWEMVKCVTVVSANDCAVALAEQLAGSEEAFVDKMNRRARELGMTHTNFVNCTGLPAPGHLTTARDISLMSRILLKDHPDIKELTTIWMDTIREGAFGLTNTNRLIRFYPGATGLKTGSTGGAMYCMAASAQREGMELIAVVLKAPTTKQRFQDAAALLDYGFGAYASKKVYPEAPLPAVPVLLGVQDRVQPLMGEECTLLLPKGDKAQVETKVLLAEDVAAPVEQGQVLGQMEVRVAGELVRSVPLVAGEAVDRLTLGGILGRLLRTACMIA